MPFYFLVSVLLSSVIFTVPLQAQTVDRAGKTEAVISAQGSEIITLNEELLFLSQDLTVVGRGQVVKVSESGKTAVVKITSGKAIKGMSVEKASARKVAPKSLESKASSANPLDSNSAEPNPYETRRPKGPHSSDYPTMGLSKEDREVLRYAPVDNTQYVIGGILGTWLGFGIGHAVQGRYSQSGWIFTAGQLGSGAVLVVGALRCMGHHVVDNRCADPLATLGAAGFIGFKIWEIVDLWATPPSMNHRYNELRRRPSSEEASPVPALTFDGMILPTKDGVTAGVRMTF